MSNISEKEVYKIAKLARIRIRNDEHAQKLAKELSSIFTVIDELQPLDVSNVPVTINVIETTQPMREDIVKEGNITDKILKNAPSAEFDCFTVPKVIE
ncbi:MAG: Asp-tRNA(Asn)/Glu-tRNA(Gln) amidotransferase subunit GatC [Sphingobacteriia bacterium]|nr:Asp-tRNA(Asn)/Glu-tRNA(Gln) amidotransferase subunit GatC [Sphingobacteriia bacterium]